MAHAEAGKAFAKLKLDTTAPSRSSYIQIKKDSARDSDESDGSDKVRREDQQYGSSSQPYSYGSSDERYATYVSESAVVDESRQTSTGTTPETSIELAFRRRKTSIGFADNVILETGDSVPLEEPLPKPETPSRPSHRGRSILQDMYESERKYNRAFSDSRLDEFDPQTGRRIGQRRLQDHYKEGQPRWPMLDTTVSDLAREQARPQYGRATSLLSPATLSPTSDKVKSPSDADYITSSPLQQPNTPISFPTGSLPFGSRSTSHRSRSYRETGTMRSGSSRRSTGRSGTPRSAASAFLRSFSQSTKDPEPDDQGQEIGDQSGYVIGAQIGQGGFSIIKEVISFENNEKIKNAVKIVRKQVKDQTEEQNDKLQEDFDREVSVWRYLKHPFVLPLLAVYETKFATFCIMPLIKGGTLVDMMRIRQKAKKGGLPLQLAKRYTYQLASAIRYLHEDMRVVHRDIKLDNVLIDDSDPATADEGGNLLLCDFGFADFTNNEHRMSPGAGGAFSTSFTGSVAYAAPETVYADNEIYSTQADIWSFGVVVYTLLTGKRPFSHEFEPTLAAMVSKGDWDETKLYIAPAVTGKDDEVVKMVRGCLTLDPDARWPINDVLASPWFDGCAEQFDNVPCSWIPDKNAESTDTPLAFRHRPRGTPIFINNSSTLVNSHWRLQISRRVTYLFIGKTYVNLRMPIEFDRSVTMPIPEGLIPVTVTGEPPGGRLFYMRELAQMTPTLLELHNCLVRPFLVDYVGFIIENMRLMAVQ